VDLAYVPQNADITTNNDEKLHGHIFGSFSYILAKAGFGAL
jgi:hypothetical protein